MSKRYLTHGRPLVKDQQEHLVREYGWQNVRVDPDGTIHGSWTGAGDLEYRLTVTAMPDDRLGVAAEGDVEAGATEFDVNNNNLGLRYGLHRIDMTIGARERLARSQGAR